MAVMGHSTLRSRPPSPLVVSRYRRWLLRCDGGCGILVNLPPVHANTLPLLSRSHPAAPSPGKCFPLCASAEHWHFSNAAWRLVALGAREHRCVPVCSHVCCMHLWNFTVNELVKLKVGDRCSTALGISQCQPRRCSINAFK